MKKKELFACIGALMLSFTSCVKDESVCIVTNVESKESMARAEVQNLIQQARYGDADAYKTLAYCYRDGQGVTKSAVNALFMYSMYCNKTGKKDKDIVELFEEGSPYRLLFEILDAPDLNQETERKIEQLQQISPADAKIIKPIRDFLVFKKNNNVLETLKEAEAEGSELASLLQVLYHEEKRDTAMYRQCLLRMADKHPMLNAKIAQLYETRYATDDDFPYVLKAMEYYYKVDSFGMLTPRQANHLWSIYDYFGQKGLLEYDKKEVERLRKIMKN